MGRRSRRAVGRGLSMGRGRAVGRGWSAGRGRSVGSGFARAGLGAVSGLFAGWVMNRVEVGLASVGSPATRLREREASKAAGEPPTQRVATIVAGAFGFSLNPEQKKVGAALAHYATSATWGCVFALLPRSLRRQALLTGIGFGAALWLIEDEWLLTRLRLAARPRAYPISTHAKGLAAHLVWGASTAAGHRALSQLVGGPAGVGDR